VSRKPLHNEVNIVEDADKINIHVLKKPVTRRLALRLLSVDNQPRYTMPVENFIVLVKALLNYDQALDGAIAVTAEHMIRGASRREREAKKSWVLRREPPSDTTSSTSRVSMKYTRWRLPLHAQSSQCSEDL